MNKRENHKIIIREATLADNDELVCLTSLAPMMGKIAIRIDRKPDFFRLLEMRGPSFVIVATAGKKIVGSCSVSAIDSFVEGNREPVYYMGDFKVHPDFRGSTVAGRLARAVMKKAESINADLCFCTVAYGNADVIPFFKGRAFLPVVKAAGIFHVFQIFPTPFKSADKKYTLDEGPFKSSAVGMFNEFMKGYKIGPAWTESSFGNATLITASLNNEVVSAITLVDTVAAKQNVLIRIPFYLQCLFKISGAVNLIFPLIKVPRMHHVVRVLYVKSFTCKPGHQQALKILLERARNIAYQKKYNFLAAGIHEKDPLFRVFASFPKFTFKSMGFIASLKNNQEKVDRVLQGIPFEDYSLV